MRHLGFRRIGLGLTLVLALTAGMAPYASGAKTASGTSSGMTTSKAPDQPATPNTTLAGAAAAVEPSEHDGDQSARLECSDIDPGWEQLAVTGHPVSGNYTVSDSFRTVQISVLDSSAGGKTVNWHSDGPIDAVILLSGQDAATYEYEPPARSDTGLLPPLKDRDGRNLAAVLVCYDPVGAVVAIDLSLVDSADPVEVGEQFEYLLSASSTDPIAGASISVALPPEVTLRAVPGCTAEGLEVSCAPPLGQQPTWQTTITVSAERGGNAVARATFHGFAGGDPVEASAVEVTRIIGAGHGGGCADHDDEDECGDGGAGLVAACSAIDADAVTVVVPGPFANRRYLVEGPGGARIWVTIVETGGRQTLSWDSNLPIDAVLARTGRDIAEYRYGPLTFDGGGVVGPPGGKSGAPRPIADAAFCYVPRKAVDLGLGSFSLPSLQVGVPGTFVVMVANSGYEEALGVSLMITPDAGARLHSCGDQTGAEDRCSLGGVAPDSVVPVEFDLVAGSDGEGKVSIEVRALNESPDAVSDNLLVLRYRVDATSPTRSPAVSSPAVPGGTNAPEELPLTGPGHGLLWLAVLATVLVGGGVLITATGRSGG